MTVDNLTNSRQAQSVRVRVHVLREAMNAAKLDYLRALLEWRSLQGDRVASDRITRQITNLVRSARPKRARNVKEKQQCN